MFVVFFVPKLNCVDDISLFFAQKLSQSFSGSTRHLRSIQFPERHISESQKSRKPIEANQSRLARGP